ncbi:NADH-quinone oxidoreductase subunit NuoB [Thermogladius sp. 4427co]|uniref:NADH-quinone oxidoreductase subunit NuoB n=1 Tax=Thermogladius sp. 4427co TaxID=3450718 RepID=UPI003F7AEE9B
MSGLLQRFINWARSRSPWMIHYCAACGAVEFPPLVMSPLDWERYGYMPVPSPRQSDFIAGMGYLTRKTVKLMINLYRQMPSPKYVVAGCNCTATGGLYWDSYATYKRLDDFFTVSGWVLGCMPMPDDWTSLIVDLRRQIENGLGSDKLVGYEELIKKIEEEEKRWRIEYFKSVQDKMNYEFRETYPECAERYEDKKLCITTIENSKIRAVLSELKSKGYILLSNIDAVDYPKNGVIELYYIVENPSDGSQVAVKTYVPRARPVIDTVSDIYPNALFIEREVYEMMGIEFKGHPRLEKWILDGNWEGPPPLRKDVDTASYIVKVFYKDDKYGR